MSAISIAAPGMLRRLPHTLAILSTLLGGCGGSRDTAPTLTPMPPVLAGVYSGELPCSNCAAIAATLWLREDGRFVLRQRFVDEGGASKASTNSADVTHSLGRWRWDEAAAEAVLTGRGPERRLRMTDDATVELLVPSPTPQLLVRDASAPRFEDRLTLDGESTVTENAATFRECLTGLTFTIADTGAYRELRRQHRRMNARGKLALTTLEGHLVTVTHAATTSERLVVDRFVTIKPGRGC
jgi:copper homeostasis protein (lipoprotein)